MRPSRAGALNVGENHDRGPRCDERFPSTGTGVLRCFGKKRDPFLLVCSCLSRIILSCEDSPDSEVRHGAATLREHSPSWNTPCRTLIWQTICRDSPRGSCRRSICRDIVRRPYLTPCFRLVSAGCESHERSVHPTNGMPSSTERSTRALHRLISPMDSPSPQGRGDNRARLRLRPRVLGGIVPGYSLTL